MAYKIDFVVLFLVSFLILVFKEPKIRNDSKNKATKYTIKFNSLSNLI